MSEFLISNIETVALILAAIAGMVYAIYTKQWEMLRSSALSFMLSAERLMATMEGKQKMDWVYAAVWQRLPRWLKTFVTEKTLREKLQEWYDLTKDMLEDD